MTCEHYKAALSARSDGEDPGMDEALLDAHLRTCASCRQFRSSIEAMRGATRVGAAPQIPDLSREVVRQTAAADRVASFGIVRGVLAIVAVQIIAFSVPDLLAIDTAAGPAHAARHLGAFSIAYAAGLLMVVVRPARARTMLNVAIVLGAALVLTAIVDVAQGRVPLIGEATHLPELFSVWFLWLLARPKPDPAAAPAPARDADGAPLRLVPHEDDEDPTT